MGWAIALHGGAGSISRDLPADRREEAEAALRHCLDTGASALRSSRSSLDVAELVVRELENIPIFNAGRGSVLTTEGTVEMEACIMDGVTKNCGAVSGLSTVVNPISLARLVMEQTPHIYLAFDGAERFAREQGVQTMDTSYFITEANLRRLEQAKAANIPLLDHTSEKAEDEIQINCPIGGTVGCVVADGYGHCAAATSTGGFVNKMVGRIGDTPIIGAGTYANNMCAVSATGKGEFIMRATIARDVAALMEFRGLSLAEAANEVIEKRAQEGTAGLVAVSSNGEIAVAFNTSGLYRAYADESGFSQIGIWH